MATGARLFGLSNMRAKIAQFQRQFPDRVAAALRPEAEIEMTESKRRTPVDTTPNAPHPGQLRASGRVQNPEREGSRIFVRMTYGTDYAIYVHENPDAIHPIGQWRFLASVLDESAPYMSRRIAARFKGMVV